MPHEEQIAVAAGAARGLDPHMHIPEGQADPYGSQPGLHTVPLTCVARHLDGRAHHHVQRHPLWQDAPAQPKQPPPVRQWQREPRDLHQGERWQLS